jgi:serine protease Do
MDRLHGVHLRRITSMNRNVIALGLCALIAGSGGYLAAGTGASESHAEMRVHEPSTYRDVVKRVLPAVVRIEATPKAHLSAAQPPTGPSPYDGFPGLPDELRKYFDHVPQPFPPPPNTAPGRAIGSGFVVDPSGIILTNEHVVRGADEVSVLLQDGRKLTARDIKRDPKTDLAVLRVEANERLPSLKLGNSDEVEVGDRVLAIGAPLGMTGTVTSGIISAKGRDIHMNMYEDFLQTDAAINPGNSGGPLVNLAGEVVGINSAMKSATGGSQGIGLAIASNLARNVMDQLRDHGSVKRGYLGVQAGPLDADVAPRLGVAATGGVVISKVGANTPAAKCGLQDGDILTGVGGQTIKDQRHLQQLVAGLPIDKPVELAIVRDGTPKKLMMTVEMQPESYGVTGDLFDVGHTHLGKVGIKVKEMTPEMAGQFGFPESITGVLITEVEPNSAAAAAGLQNGVLILKVDQHAVKTVKDVEAALEKGSLEKGIVVQVRTPKAGTSYVLLKKPAAIAATRATSTRTRAVRRWRRRK